MRLFLFKLLGNKPVTLTLLYSGHLHGWNKKDFHSRCDSKGRTVSLFQIKDGDCIGGYTSQCWESSVKWKADSSAFLFNLTRSRHFPSRQLAMIYIAVETRGLVSMEVKVTSLHTQNHLMVKTIAAHGRIYLVTKFH